MKNPESAGSFFPSSKFPGTSKFFGASPLILLAIGLHLVIVLPLAWKLNIWLDEAWTMDSTAHGLLNAWHEAIATERQAPLYFVVLAAWRTFGDSIFFARVFSIVCSIGTIALVPALVKRFMPQKAGSARNLLPFAIALHPYLIWASTEARVYALVILLSGLLLILWFDGYAAPENNRKSRILYAALALFALYTNYYLGFLLFAGACALAVLRRWQALAHYTAQMAAAGLVFTPLIVIIRQQFATNSDYYHEQATILEGIKAVWSIFNSFLLPSAESGGIAVLRLWAARIGAALVLYLVIRNLRKISPMAAALSVIAGVMSVFLIAAFFLLGSDYIQIRHSAPLFIPLLLLFATLAEELTPPPSWFRLFYAWLILLIIFVPVLLFSTYSQTVKNGDWNRVAEYIRANENPDQPITAFDVNDVIPLKFAYHGENQILPEKLTVYWRAEDKPLTATRWSKQIEFITAQIPADREYFWLVTNSFCDGEKTAIECRPLEDYVNANFTVEKSADFYLRRVRLLRRK